MADTTLHAPARPSIFATALANPLRTAVTILTAGAFSTVAFDFFGQALSPATGNAQLAPVGLANAVISKVFGAGWRPGAEMLHYAAGMIAYPAGWVLFAEPLRERVAPMVPWFAAAFLYGVVLWVFALYVMAHLVAGNAPFLGWGNITWVALWGHVLFAVVTAIVTRVRQTS
ncbi:MAG: hypothetical protein AAFR47_16505 [Pseudomonadota bacterium]